MYDRRAESMLVPYTGPSSHPDTYPFCIRHTGKTRVKPIAERAAVLRKACASDADEGVRWPKFWSGDGKCAALFD